MKTHPSKKTRILAVGDIHGDTGLVKRLARKAEKENVDLVILAGDITFIERSVKNIVGPFAKIKKQVLLIPGNHESNATINFLAEMYPHTKNIHGCSFSKNNLGVFGAGYDPNVGPFWTEDDRIFEVLKKGHDKIKNAKKKIMVTHTTPSGGKADFLGFVGSDAVAKAIKKFRPDILINAHIHEVGGIEEKIGRTKVINVSRQARVFEV